MHSFVPGFSPHPPIGIDDPEFVCAERLTKRLLADGLATSELDTVFREE